ncbi:MAG: Crp/Fnr family transcriptional regulator, partial [Deltaproteobacteria bacterium]|nr:Crp/Fnr family transcriptional regulator [Deltaproteobacteria bacterium]
SGRVKISRITPDGHELTLDFIEPGELFGEMALVEEEASDTVAEPLEDAILCTIPLEEFRRLLMARPELAFRVTKLIGLRRRQIESRIEDLAFRDIPARLARLLVNLAEEYGVADSQGIQLRIRLSQRELAHLIGASRERVNQILIALRQQGLIEYAGRSLRIRDRAGLARLT